MWPDEWRTRYNLFCHGSSTEHVPPLQHSNLLPRPREIGGLGATRGREEERGRRRRREGGGGGGMG